MFTIEINDAEVTAALENALSALGDLTPLMQQLGETVVQQTKDRFGTGRAPDGTPWAPNSPVTLARKKDTRPLFGPNNRLHEEFGLSVGADFAEISSVLPYAAVMQFGAVQGQFGARMGRTRKTDKVKAHDYFMLLPWGDIPARPFLGLSDQDRSDILAEISEAIEATLTP